MLPLETEAHSTEPIATFCHFRAMAACHGWAPEILQCQPEGGHGGPNI